jgi:hypothetical protein
MISKDYHRVSGSDQQVVPMSQCSHNGEKFMILNVVIALWES